MPGGVEELIISVGLAGQDDVVRGFGQIGRAAEEAARLVAESFGTAGKVVGGVGAAVIGTTVAFGTWAKHAGEVANSLQNIASQAGESVESISSLQQAMVAMGGNADSLSSSFRRMSTVIQRTWTEIVKESRDSRDKQIADLQSVESASIGIERAREQREQGRAKRGEPGARPMDQRQQEALQVREENLRVEQAELGLRQAQKKADEDRRNDILNVAAAVQSVVSGEKTLTEASKTANLEVGNVIKGIVFAAGDPNAQAGLKNFTGNFNELTQMGPKVKETLYTFADFIKNAKNPTLEQAAAVQFFGRSIDQNLMTSLRGGSAALREHEERAERFGFVYSHDMVEGAERFHKSYNRLTSDISTTFNQFGMTFAKAFAPSFDDLNRVLEENHKNILKWADNIAKAITPMFDGFMKAMAGLAAAMSGDQLDPMSAAGKWQAFFQPAVDAASDTASAVIKIWRDTKREIDAIIAEFSRRSPMSAGALTKEAGLKAVQENYGKPPDVSGRFGPEVLAPLAGGKTDERFNAATTDNTSATKENTTAVNNLATIMRPAPKGAPTAMEKQAPIDFEKGGIFGKGRVVVPGEAVDLAKGRTVQAPAGAEAPAKPPAQAAGEEIGNAIRRTVPDILAAVDERRERPGERIAPTLPGQVGATGQVQTLKQMFPSLDQLFENIIRQFQLFTRQPIAPPAQAEDLKKLLQDTEPPGQRPKEGVQELNQAAGSAATSVKQLPDPLNRAKSAVDTLVDAFFSAANRLKEFFLPPAPKPEPIKFIYPYGADPFPPGSRRPPGDQGPFRFPPPPGGTPFPGPKEIFPPTTPQERLLPPEFRPERPFVPPPPPQPEPRRTVPDILAPPPEVRRPSDSEDRIQKLLDDLIKRFPTPPTTPPPEKPPEPPTEKFGGAEDAIRTLGELKPAAESAAQGAQTLTSTESTVESALTTLSAAFQSAADRLSQINPSSGGSAGEVRAFGGLITGPGGPRSDRIPIWTSNREYVMQAAATNYYGEGFMGAVNNMLLPRFSMGGLVDAMQMALAPRAATGGMISMAAGTTSSGRPLNLYIGGEKISGLTATENAANSIVRAATSRAVRSGGVKASWYRG